MVLYSQLERLKTEHVLDVFQGIKAARTQRMGIVNNSVSHNLREVCVGKPHASDLEFTTVIGV